MVGVDVMAGVGAMDAVDAMLMLVLWMVLTWMDCLRVAIHYGCNGPK